jgi:hypothetical protein
MATNVTIQEPLYIGEDQELHFTVYDDDGTTPLDVTGYTTQLKLLLLDAVVLTIAGSIVDAAAGLIDIVFASADTSSLEPGEYEFYFRRTGTGTKHILSHGTLQLKDAPSWA